MKITLTELRQMVRNIISEMEQKSFKSTNYDFYVEEIQKDVDDFGYRISESPNEVKYVAEEFNKNADSNFMAIECIELYEMGTAKQHLAYVTKKLDYEFPNMTPIEEGKFGEYEYYVYKSNGEYEIHISNSDAENFIFVGEKKTEEETEEFEDEY